MSENPLEHETHLIACLRDSVFCPACPRMKTRDQITCWDCWRRPDGGLKWWGGSVAEWLLRRETMEKMEAMK